MSSINDFQTICSLGSGSFASVYKVKRISDGQEYALKKVKLPSLKAREKENAFNEVRILASINDRNIIGYKEAFYDDASQTLCIVMEFASGGDLLKKIQDHKKKGTYIPEETIWSYFIQMLQGLRTLHSMKILHRDLKCANIFLGNETIKLGDLNVSKVTQQGLAQTQAGTPYYCSPEVWQDKTYGSKSDIWSLGCVVYELCALMPPFRAQTMDGLYKKVLRGLYDRIPACYSSELSKVIAMCLNVNPNMRPDCERLLAHPLFIAKMNEAELDNMKKIPAHIDLLNTIKVPTDLNNLAKILPKPKYKSSSKSLIDIDEVLEKDDDLRRMVEQYNQKLSIPSPANSNAANRRNFRKQSHDVSIDVINKSRDYPSNLPEIQRRVPISPRTDAMKKQSEIKLTAIQRAAKGVLDIFKKRDIERPILHLEKDYVGPTIAISKPNSRGGYPRYPIDPSTGKPAGLPRLNYMPTGRSYTPGPSSRKASGDYSLDYKDTERAIKKEYSGFRDDVNHARIYRPIY
jgi:serine/threonine protein kinase